MPRGNPRDLTGLIAGRLTVLSFHDIHNSRRRWLCRCECGNETIVAANALTNGHTQSCGCLSRETTSANRRTHGLTGTPEYRSWKAMRQRCLNPNQDNYKHYGGKGITICERWMNSFQAFLDDMGPQPAPGYSIDRIDRTRGYEPGNVRWATSIDQHRNQSNNRVLTHDGTSCTIAEWAERTGLSPHLIDDRVRRGWSDADALSTPKMRVKRDHDTSPDAPPSNPL